ncbi:hypothetical protein [Brachybacterium sp. GCM10030252]|uniref:hypothetical protein n=1 Tax=Brachybacterium sp. GCM10030252 TaxID=3273380 RepID=UPI0036090EA5
MATELLNASRMNRGTLPPGADADHFISARHAGLWHIDSAVAESVIGLPADASGQQGEFLVLQSTTGMQMFFPYGCDGASCGYVRKLLDAVTDEWSEWSPWEPTSGDDFTAVAQHEIRRAQFTSSMGGPISTGGRAAVALRCDHGCTGFAAKVLPAVRARGIKVAQAYNPRNWHRAENEGVTADDLNGWVAAGDVEIINHSANHLPADTQAALFDQIVNGLAEIEAEVPAAAGTVWGFAPPGVSSGNYGGFNDGRTPKRWGTYAGRLILQHHAIGFGYLAGTSQRVIDGTPRDGQGHVTMNRQSVAGLKASIDQAITNRTGLQLMLHPSQLDATGNLSTAQFLEVLDYIAAMRDAGLLVTLSPYEMLLADST